MFHGDNRTMKKYSIIAITAIYILLSGCATAPLATIQDDTIAKLFKPTKDKSNIYLYSSHCGNMTFDRGIILVAIDNATLRKNSFKSYLKLTLEPGKHTITSQMENAFNSGKITTLEIETEKNKNYFIEQNFKTGFLTYPWVEMNEVFQSKGIKKVKECKLAKT
jgi:PBP1b-binding outer membrane lipoprotein LpoB